MADEGLKVVDTLQKVALTDSGHGRGHKSASEESTVAFEQLSANLNRHRMSHRSFSTVISTNKRSNFG